MDRLFFLFNHYHIFVNICEYYSTVKKMRVNSHCIMRLHSLCKIKHMLSLLFTIIYLCVYSM